MCERKREREKERERERERKLYRLIAKWRNIAEEIGGMER
jgi:hypothetical protein